MTKINFNARRNKVFECIVTAYVELGAPVGSVTLCNRSNLNLSPASIRNIMGELEELGLIAQPHTSAGRMPTDTGYRFYVDNIMELDIVIKEEQENICSACRSAKGQLDVLLETALKLLSDISNEVSLVLFPRLKENTPKEIKLASFGWHHLFRQPEFKDTSKSNRLLEALEEKKELVDFVGESVDAKQVKVFIGTENKCSHIQDCSIILSGYGVQDDAAGAIGLIGPTRMPYKRLIPIVGFIANYISRELEEA